MWAPADLFIPLLNIFLLPAKRVVSYLYEHLPVLGLLLLGIAVSITVATVLGDRRASRG